MSYEKNVLARARTRHAEQLDRFRSQQQNRREQVYERIPRIREIDRELRVGMAEVMAAAFRDRDDPALTVERQRLNSRALEQEHRELLLQAGYPADYLSDGPMCRKCGDSGYLGSRMCSCLEDLCKEEQKQELTSLLSTRSSDFDEFSLDYYPETIDAAYGISPRQQMEMVYEACVNYARKFSLRSRSILMNGSSGLGKTFLSACIANQVVSAGYSVVYDTAIHVFSCMERQKFGSAGEEEQRLAERIFACDLLILDDLGTEMTTSFVTSALYSIVNGRILDGKPTIISTNLNMGELARRYSQPIASRLMGEYLNLVFLGQDIRILRSGNITG